MGTLLSDLSKQYQIDSCLKVILFYLVKKCMDEDASKEKELLNLLRNVDINKTTRTEVIE